MRSNVYKDNFQSRHSRHCKMGKYELPMQFIFCKHLQVIVSRLGCSSRKRLRRNRTAAAIGLFLWRAPLGLSSLRPVKSHCSEHVTHSIRSQLLHFPASATEPALHVFAVPGFSSSSLLCLVHGLSEGADVAAMHIFWAAA